MFAHHHNERHEEREREREKSNKIDRVFVWEIE